MSRKTGTGLCFPTCDHTLRHVAQNGHRFALSDMRPQRTGVRALRRGDQTLRPAGPAEIGLGAARPIA
ncbi:MAG: hypothetical protein CSA74_03920 [Rhodobacterales bacterium]|nr:MAG: hypothetical protein CSA74_03920 [Rhodobacterales bacterium]